VIAEVDPDVRAEVAAILAWLAGRADSTGRLGAPVEIASGLLARLCGDRRIERDGRRRRATTLALVELERLGLLTMASNYRVGVVGRRWCCWYRFGSGELPRQLCLPLDAWRALEGRAPAAAAAAAAGLQRAAEAAAEGLELATAPAGPRKAPSGPEVSALLVGEREVRRACYAF
jgi:hypothetical protein